MRTAAALLLLTLCAASAQSARADEDIIVRPKGRPPTEAEGAELPPYPEHAPPRPAGAEFEDQDYFWLNDNDGKQQWEDPSVVLTDEEGTETYVDPNTGQPTDVKPAEAAWLSMWDEEYEHEFFYNELTNVIAEFNMARLETVQETTWSVPYNFAWHKVWVDEDGNVISPHEEEDSFEDGEFAGEEGGELPDWDPSGSYEEDGSWEGEGDLADEGPWEDEGGAAEEQPGEEELAEEEVLRQEEFGDVGEL